MYVINKLRFTKREHVLRECYVCHVFGNRYDYYRQDDGSWRWTVENLQGSSSVSVKSKSAAARACNAHFRKEFQKVLDEFFPGRCQK